MKAKINDTKSKKKEKNYVIIDGVKHSRTWAAALSLKGTGQILDMKAVLK